MEVVKFVETVYNESAEWIRNNCNLHVYFAHQQCIYQTLFCVRYFVVLFVLVDIKPKLARFSLECRAWFAFAITLSHDWLKKRVLLFHPMKSKDKTNRDSFASVFPRFGSATYNYFKLWLVHWILLCPWFYETKLKYFLMICLIFAWLCR